MLHLKRLDQSMGGRATEQDIRTFLGGFNFRGDRVFEAVAPFSGGEKARLALALVRADRRRTGTPSAVGARGRASHGGRRAAGAIERVGAAGWSGDVHPGGADR